MDKKHEINDYLNTWGLSLKEVNSDRLREALVYTGISFIRIDFNAFHKDMIKFDNHNWFTYHKDNFQYLINERFIDEAKRLNNTVLMREIKLRNLLT